MSEDSSAIKLSRFVTDFLHFFRVESRVVSLGGWVWWGMFCLVRLWMVLEDFPSNGTTSTWWIAGYGNHQQTKSPLKLNWDKTFPSKAWLLMRTRNYFDQGFTRASTHGFTVMNEGLTYVRAFFKSMFEYCWGKLSPFRLFLTTQCVVGIDRRGVSWLSAPRA